LNNDNTSTGKSTESHEQTVMVSGGAVQLEGILSIPNDARALIVFAYDRLGDLGNTLNSLHLLTAKCHSTGLSTLMVNLLTSEEEELNKTTHFFQENIEVLHQRVIGITNWLIENANTHGLNLGYFGTNVCAAAILAASTVRPDAMNAIVAVEPRTDLVNSYLPRIVAPTLFIAPEKNGQALTSSRTAIALIATDTNLDIVTQARKGGLANTVEIISGVQNAFENNQSMYKVGELTSGWFTRFL
jgi:putative phosphoribosyl transferase